MTEKPVRSSPAILRLSVPCDLKQVRTVAQATHDFLAGHGCTEQELADCELTLVEGCNNAIEHARTSEKTPIIVEVVCSNSEIELRITDNTSGFDWPEKAMLPKGESEKGRGVFLIQSLVDYANYFRSKSGNILLLRKKRKGGV